MTFPSRAPFLVRPLFAEATGWMAREGRTKKVGGVLKGMGFGTQSSGKTPPPK